jgi:glycosyltransferase involved in cell wall biosynthesis
MVHDFLPAHVAGVEVYTDHLTRRLAREHEVGLLYSEVVHDAPNYELRRGRHGEVETFEVVNNYELRGFRETYQNAAIDHRIVEVLDEFRPDVVHIQHFINLSIGAVVELKRRGIPMVMTLHDHWLACASGGQRFHPRDGTRCDELDAGRCGDCTAHLNALTIRARGVLQQIRETQPASGPSLSLAEIEPESIQVPESRFVYRDQYELEGHPQPTWVAHPPARLDFRVHLDSEGSFSTAVAMHPGTFESPGGGVRFRVLVDGETRCEVSLDPKRQHADRTSRRLNLDLEAGDHLLQLQTESVPADRSDYCTAGWVAPRVEVRIGRATAAPTQSGRVASRLGRLGAQVAGRLQTRAIEKRWESMRQLGREIDVFLAPSGYLGDAMVEFGLPRDRVRYCDYGFVTRDFKRRVDLPRVARRFTFIGSLVRHKGVHLLLEAFRRLPEDARLDVWGSPDYDPSYFQELVLSTQHPGVHFRGVLDPESVPAFLQTADVQIIPSIWNENSPLTIHEAFLAGIPVVASRMGGHVELLASGGGLLYEPDDVDELAVQLGRLYEETGLVQKLAASVPPVKAMDFHCEELVSLYSELVQASSLAKRLV